MARQPNPDLTNTLTMLHTAIVHVEKNIRDALDKGVEKLESASQAAHAETTKEVVDELGRMRANFRDVYNKLNSSGESLNSTVHDVVTQLRAELREIRIALTDLTAPTTTSGPTSEVHQTSATGGDRDRLVSAPVTTLTKPDGLPEDSTLSPSVPAQRAAAQESDSSPGSALPVDVIRQAVREVLTEELAPVLTKLTAPVGTVDSPADDQAEPADRLRDAAGEIRQELGAALAEARSALASLQQEIAGLHAAVEELRPQPDTSAETVAAEVSHEHSNLLKTAARVSSASLLCHRDIWEFITAHAGRHPHFRVPPQVADEGNERIRAALSGRSLIALLISLYSIKHTASDGDGDQELAATVYERIEESLTDLTPSGQPVTITLDDRTATGSSAAESRSEADGDPENPGTPPTSLEQNTDLGEEAGSTAA